MRVSDFIVVYNETFKYIYQRKGKADLLALWQFISDYYCQPLSDLIENKGLLGMLEYWGGHLEEEKADFEVRIENDIFCMDMHRCPSIATLKENNREMLSGELSYCHHCPHLYPPVAAKHGYKMVYTIEFDEDGNCSGRCKMRAAKEK